MKTDASDEIRRTNRSGLEIFMRWQDFLASECEHAVPTCAAYDARCEV